MKEIKIQKLSMSNFKGCGALTLELGWKNAAIYGDNATGKTTVYDALTWLLFGKDSRGSSDQETIKPLDANGNVKDHNAVTTVEAVLTVGGGTDSSTSLRSAQNDNGAHCAPLQVTLRKEMQESWVTRRGSSAPVFDGNEFRYFWDGVPCKKNEYARRVGELVDEDVFRMLTSVTAFAFDLPWRKRREILYELSGVQTMSDLALLQEAAKMARDGGTDSSASLRSDQNDRTGERIATSPAASRNDNGEDYEHLAEQIGGGMTLDELKRVLLARRKGLLQTRDQTPARIDELNKQLAGLQVIDFEAAKGQLSAAQANLKGARQALANVESGGVSEDLRGKMDALWRRRDTLNQREMAERSARQDKILSLSQQRDELTGRNNEAFYAHKAEIRRVEDELRALENENEAWRRKQEAALPDVNALRRVVKCAEDDVSLLDHRVKDLLAEAETYDKLVETDRDKWIEVSRESFQGAFCPTCGRELPADQLQAARAKFENEQAGRLEQIQQIAEIHKQRAAKAREDAKRTDEELNQAHVRLEKADDELKTAEATPGTVSDMKDFVLNWQLTKQRLQALQAETGGIPDYQKQFDAISLRIAEIKAAGRSDELQASFRALEDEERSVEAQKAAEEAGRRQQADGLRRHIETAERLETEARAILAKESMISAIEGRVSELRDAQKRAGAEMEDIDRDLFAMESFIRWKTRFIEDSINGLFRIVTFRLFREQANGGLEERCDVVVDGVPYMALNNGARINAGMDIIHRLAEHYAVRVPLFVDNAESVTRLEDAGTQVIRLVVSEQDKSLRVEV